MRLFIVVFVLLSVLLVPLASQATPPQRHLQWPGGWHMTTDELEGPDYLQPPQHYKTLQHILAEAGLAEPPPGPPPVPVFGTREILVILVELSDATPDPAHTTAYFDDRFFDTSPPSVNDYYTEVSYDNFTYIRGDVLGWYPSTYSMADWDDVDSRPVVVEAIQDVDANFNFAPYDFDTNGTVTNDELTIFIIVSGDRGGAFHWYTTSSVATGDGVNVEGEFCATHEGRHIGSYCHELGHDLGLPDLYDTDTTGTGRSEGIGQFGLMGGGSWTFSHMTAWCKIQLGWITPTVVAASGYHAIDAAETNAEAFILVDPGHATTEYFLVENRHSPSSYYETIGAPIAPDGTLPDDGIVIYHVDDTKADDWINHGHNNVNSDETHKCVDVETAEHPTSHVVDADDLDAGVNRGDADDLWDCGEYDFHDTSTPCGGVWYGGIANEMSVRQMGCVGTTMMAYLSISNDPPVAACKDFAAHGDASCCVTVNVTDIDDGSADPDGDDDIASLCITAVDGGNVGCLQEAIVCGKGIHEVTLTITDLAGESDECIAYVEVENQPPVAVCQVHSGEADDDCCIEVGADDIDGGSYDDDGAGDISSICITDVDGESVDCEEVTTVCGAGTHYVTLTVTDWCGDSDDCIAEVEVVDVTPPEITVELNRYVLWPPNHKMSDITATVTVEDNCDDAPTFVLTDITSNEDDNGTGDGDTVDDIQGEERETPDVEFQLRSERAGGGDGREYTIVYTASDASGNTAEATVVVRVPHDQSGAALAGEGFDFDGSDLVGATREFSLVIPSAAGFDPREVDLDQAYVGNHVGVVCPRSHSFTDINLDEIPDLELVYDAEAARRLREISGDLFPLGMHYQTANTTDYSVENIFDLPILVSSTPDEVDSAVNLFQFVPNPLSDGGRLAYAVPGPAMASVGITVYNVGGQRVRSLVDVRQKPGIYEVTWDGRNDAGVPVQSGIYFLRMQIGDQERMIRVAVAR